MNFEHKVYLAPMAGATDAPMRRLCFSLGADGAVTEMVSAKAVCYGDEKTGGLSSVTEGEGAVSVQLFGHEPQIVAEAALRVVTGDLPGARFDHAPSAIDINMGCPVNKIVSSGDGSALMRTPDVAAKIVRATADALSEYGVPLTVKIRSGWDADSVNAPYFASLMASQGAAAVTVHARTRAQMYSPSADWSVIKAVKDALPDTPVIGNGDVASADDAIRMMEQTGCDGVMIGREALGNPWIFREIKDKLNGRAYAPPTVDGKIAAALKLMSEVIAEKGEYVGIREARGRVAHFIKGMRGAPAVRDRLNHAETYQELEKILSDCAVAAREV